MYTFLFHTDGCDEYTNITDTWRNYFFESTYFPGYPNDDSGLSGSWWRFTGIGGDRLLQNCFGGEYGGAYIPIYVPFDLPTNETGLLKTEIAFGVGSYCTSYSFQLSVALCPEGFYIYKPSSLPNSQMSFVTCKELLLTHILCHILTLVYLEIRLSFH